MNGRWITTWRNKGVLLVLFSSLLLLTATLRADWDFVTINQRTEQLYGPTTPEARKRINEWQALQDSKNLSAKTIYNNQLLIKPIKQKLGHMKVTDITPSIVIRFIQDIQKTHLNKGLRAKIILKSILQIAKAHMIIEYNPASDLQGTLKSPKTQHRPSLTDPKEFAELLRDIDQLDDASQLYNKRILQLLSLTFVRIGMLVL